MSMKKAYIKALTDALLASTDVEAVLKSTKELLDKKGHQRLWLAVLQGTVQELEKRQRANLPEVIFANDLKPKTDKLTQVLTSLGAHTEAYKTSVDSSLIGGFIVRYQDRLIDASYKKALIDLYYKVTQS